MIRLWIALWLSLASPGLAQPVRVTSGEHDGFTRLVFDYGRPVDWQVGRSLDGYELRLAEVPPPYDLSNAFDLIGTSRLAAIWSAPDSGQLNIGLACACHAIPFEFRPGIIVIDLKDGAPPTGSSFEVMLDGTLADPITPRAVTRPRSRPQISDTTAADEPTTLSGVAPYDWTKSVHADLRASQGRLPVSPIPPSEAALLPPDPGLQPLRDQILHQIARGASQGVVDMALPTPEQPEKAPAPHPSTQIRIGEAQTSVTSADRSQQGDLDAQGHPCTDAKALTFSDWGDETLPAVDQMATLRQGLIGEFDRPDPEALARAIQFQLFLGFGAEARQLISVLDEAPPEAEIWRALSFLVDGETDPAGRFEGQAACAGPAALWAVLGDPALSPGDPIDTEAVRLAFSDLPLHLRVTDRDRYTVSFKLSYEFVDQDGVRRQPDLWVRVYRDAAVAEALACSQRPPWDATEEGDPKAGQFLSAQWQRNLMLGKWLEYLLEHGHGFSLAARPRILPAAAL